MENYLARLSTRRSRYWFKVVEGLSSVRNYKNKKELRFHALLTPQLGTKLELARGSKTEHVGSSSPHG